MDLLTANDRPGQHPPSWYAATATPPGPYPPAESTRADLAVIGGGFTGLSAALHAALAGQDVVLLEAQRVGFGASGRNGGQVGSGQRQDQDWIEARMGIDAARRLWALGEDAKALAQRLIAEHAPEAGWSPGIAHADRRAAEVPHSHAYAEKLARDYGYAQIEPLDREAMQALIPSDAVQGGFLDHGAGHTHPLRLAFGLARAAEAAGARLHEGARVARLLPGRPARLVLESGAEITAERVIVAANGYLGDLVPQVARRVMPINNFIVATEPLGDRAAQVLTRDIAVADSQFVVNYWRLSEDRRLLFGGGESYGYRFPADIAAMVLRPMLEIYPALRGVRIDHAWGGTLAITRSRMPLLARPAPNIASASGYSGHGVALSLLAGKLLALAPDGDDAALMAKVPVPPFPGGRALRSPLLALAMSWFALRDRLGV